MGGIDMLIQILITLTIIFWSLFVVFMVSHELHLQLLQIQPRTIETLEVGDVIFYLNAFGQFTRNIMHGLEWIDEFKHHAKTYKFEIINIIPHQLITLMTNLVGDVS